MAEKLKCFVCEKNKKEPLTLLTVGKFDDCVEILGARKIYKLSYSSANLPREYNGNIGYHQKCYKNFRALPARYRLSETSNSKIPESLQEDGTETR